MGGQGVLGEVPDALESVSKKDWVNGRVLTMGPPPLTLVRHRDLKPANERVAVRAHIWAMDVPRR